jgi:uncharacterized membrane protein
MATAPSLASVSTRVSGPLQLLPEGFALPPLPYLLALAVALVAVGAGFARRRPAVTGDHVLALVPWMVLGAALHVHYVVRAVGDLLAPLLGTPSVYLSVAALAGAVWLAVDAIDRPTPPVLATVGTVLAVGAVGAALLVGAGRGTLRPVVPVAGFVASVLVGAGAWIVLRRLRPAVSITEPVGVVALFGHALDGISTAVGVDLLGFGERTPLSRLVIEFAASLPTEPLIGAGWLFVLVKLAVAGVVVVLFADYVREEPAEGNLLLGFVAAVGLGPGAHNLVLFAVTGPA